MGEMARWRQKAYKVLAMMSEALTSPLRLDWRHGQGFQSVLASHLHLLIKCHNNMIFNYQQVLPPPTWEANGSVELQLKWGGQPRCSTSIRSSWQSRGNLLVGKFYKGNTAIDGRGGGRCFREEREKKNTPATCWGKGLNKTAIN